MILQRIEASNVKMFGEKTFELDVNPAGFVVSGKNSYGKSSILDLVNRCLGPAEPRTLCPGSESGFIQLTLADEGETWTVRREFKRGEVSKPDIRSTRTGKVGAYARFLSQAVDEISLEPVRRAMLASEKEQAAILLETLPITLSEGALADSAWPEAATGVAARARKLPPLDGLKAIYDDLYSRRTDINREAKSKATHAGELRNSIPEGFTGAADAEATMAGLQSAVAGNAKAEREARSEAQGAYDALLQDVQSAMKKDCATVDTEIDAKIRDLEVERGARKVLISRKASEDGRKLEVAHQNNLDGIRDQFGPEAQRLAGELAVAKNTAAQAQRWTEAMAIAKTSDEKSTALADESKRLTAALERLDKIRADAQAQVKIQGLTWVDGVPHLNGVPLSEVNTAERGKLWIRVMALRAKERDLALVVLDGCEIYDSDNFARIVASAAKTGIQWIFGRVTDEPFKITNIEAS